MTWMCITNAVVAGLYAVRRFLRDKWDKVFGPVLGKLGEKLGQKLGITFRQ